MAREADAYWATILTTTVAYDVWAMHTGHETASGGMRRYTEHHWQKFMLCGLLGGLALHFLSQDFDPANLILGKERHETPAPN